MLTNPTHHACPDCGYVWLHGQHGGHRCVTRLRARIASLTQALQGFLRLDPSFVAADNLWLAQEAAKGKPLPAAVMQARRALAESGAWQTFDLVAHLHRQRDFSVRTFGPGQRTAGVLAHIRKELIEIEAAPDDLMEWVDVILLAFDGAWRAGHEPADIAAAISAKQTRNEGRTWPDWRTAPADGAIEHVRSEGSAP